MGLTIRLRLTLLYSVLFLITGAGLLAVSYVLTTTSDPVVGMATASGAEAEDGMFEDVVGPYRIMKLDDAERSVPTRENSPDAEQADPSVVVQNGAPLTEEQKRAFEKWARAEALRAAAERQDRLLADLRSAATEQQALIRHQLVVTSGIALAVMAVVSAVLGWLMAGRALRPLRTMTGTIQRISARNVHERLAVAGPRDELKSLGDTVDGLLGRLESALESHKRFVANAAHELRTPLTLEQCLLEEAISEPEPTVDSYREQMEEVLEASQDQALLLDSLLVLATSERGLDRIENVDLAEVAGDVVRAAEPRRRGLQIRTEVRTAPIGGDPALVRRLVANLVDNAICYNAPDGWVEVSAGAEDGHCFVAVTNPGPQIAPEIVDDLLNPFERLGRTEDDGHHGLGLSIVKTIAAAHSAQLTVRARPEGGLAIRVRFPAEKTSLLLPAG